MKLRIGNSTTSPPPLPVSRLPEGGCGEEISLPIFPITSSAPSTPGEEGEEVLRGILKIDQ